MPEYKELARLYDTFGTPRDLIRWVSKDAALRSMKTSLIESFDAACRNFSKPETTKKRGESQS